MTKKLRTLSIQRRAEGDAYQIKQELEIKSEKLKTQEVEMEAVQVAKHNVRFLA